MPPLNEISLNRLESCDGSDCSDGCDGFDGYDGCDGCSIEFYRYMRLRQPNDTSTGHIRDEYGEQFGRSLSQHCVNTLGEYHVNTLGGYCDTTVGEHCVTTLRGTRVNIIRMSSGQHPHHYNVFEAI
jgi:hypothetical protein